MLYIPWFSFSKKSVRCDLFFECDSFLKKIGRPVIFLSRKNTRPVIIFSKKSVCPVIFNDQNSLYLDVVLTSPVSDKFCSLPYWKWGDAKWGIVKVSHWKGQKFLCNWSTSCIPCQWLTFSRMIIWKWWNFSIIFFWESRLSFFEPHKCSDITWLANDVW